MARNKYAGSPAPQPTAVPFLVSLILILTAATAAYICYEQQDYVAAGTVVCVAFGALYGFQRGLVTMLLSLMGIGAAYYFAPQLGMNYEQEFSDKAGTTGVLNRVLAIGIAGWAIYAAFCIAAAILLRVLFGRRSRRVGLNRHLGMFAGAAQSALAVLLFLGGFLMVEPMLEKSLIRESAPEANQVLAELGPRIRASQVGPYVEKYNPFVHVPELNKLDEVQKAVKTLRNPNRLRSLFQHPEVMALTDTPEGQAAIRELLQDPEFANLLRSGRPIDNSSIRALMESPAVLKVLELPQFLETAKRVICESDDLNSTVAAKP